MTYKSIFTVWDGREGSRATFQAALQLARQYDAHLNVLCLGYDRFQPAFGYVDISPIMVNDSIADARKQAEDLEREAKGILEIEDVKWSIETVIARVAVSHVIGDAARFSDLVVLPQPYDNDGDENLVRIVEAGLFEANIPVLVHPTAGVESIGKRIVIAWNESNEALTAIRAALPFIQAADKVEVVIIGPARHDSDRADPGVAISTMLARYGANVDVTVLPQSVPKISDILNRHILETGADLLVMGAYGHSRFRENILGGATRNTLESAAVPVLMSR